jgi:adenosine deaminase
MQDPAMNAPLSDLHRHLDGALREDTLVELSAALGLSLPQQPRFFDGMGFDAAIACFEVTLAVLQTPDAVRRIAAEICEDAAAEGVEILEIRFAPHLHRGAPPPEIVDAALDGIDGRAGLILGGLYGDPPALFDDLVHIGAPR